MLWVGLGFGFLISAIRLQALHSLADSNSVVGLTGIQPILFRWIDILLTGGLIAGDSEGIHKIATVFNNFIDTTVESAKGNKNKGGLANKQESTKSPITYSTAPYVSFLNASAA